MSNVRKCCLKNISLIQIICFYEINILVYYTEGGIYMVLEIIKIVFIDKWLFSIRVFPLSTLLVIKIFQRLAIRAMEIAALACFILFSTCLFLFKGYHYILIFDYHDDNGLVTLQKRPAPMISHFRIRPICPYSSICPLCHILVA